MSVWDNIMKALSYPSKPTEWLVRGGLNALGVGGNSNNAPKKVITAQPQGLPGLQSDNSPFGMLPDVATGGPKDPMKEYLDQLLRGLDAGKPHMLSLQEMRNRASKEAGYQFNPQIEALKSEMGATKKRAGRNRKDIGSMYSDLASSYLGDIKVSKDETKAAKEAETAAYNQLKKDTTGQYSEQLGAQSDEFKNLGISSALGEATKGQKEDLGFLNSLNATESGAQQRAIDLTGLADSSYYRKGQGIAKQEGAETIADLMGRLEDYLRQSQGEVSGLVGQRQASIEQLVNQMRQGQGDADTKWEGDRWSRLLQIAQLQRGLGQDAAQALKMQTPDIATKGLEGAYGVLSQSLGGNAQKSQDALMNLLQTQPFREGRFEGANKQIVDMTPENAAYQARQYASQKGLSPAETDALVKSVYAYYGKLK